MLKKIVIDSGPIIIDCIFCWLLLQTCLWLCYSPSVLNRRGVKKMEMYCVKCRAKQTVTDYKEVVTKNGRKAAKSVCPKCGTGMYKIMGKA